MISHYFGNREALVDAMAQRIIDAFNSRTNEALAHLAPSAGFMELVDVFYGSEDAIERTEILWTEIVAYATRSETVRDRLRQSYDKMLWAVDETLRREYPQAPASQLQTAAYTVGILLDRAPTFELIDVKGSPLKSAKVAIAKVLESLE